jgi:hypothetical protein
MFDHSAFFLFSYIDLQIEILEMQSKRFDVRAPGLVNHLGWLAVRLWRACPSKVDSVSTTCEPP